MNRRKFINTTWPLTAAAMTTPLPRLRKEDDQAKKKILIYSGWNTKNIGDQGHTPGTLRFFESYFPQAEITVWIAHTNREISSMILKRFPRVKLTQGRINEKGETDSEELQKAFDEADVVIHNSGMIYNSFWKPSTFIDACIASDKPYVIYGQSFDGFKDSEREVLVEKLSKCKAIYCRDVKSYYYLRDINVQAPTLEFGPDGCFGIDLVDETKATNFLNSNQLDKKQFIVIIIRTNSGKKPQKMPKWYVGDTSQNPWDPTDEDIDQNELWASKLRAIIIAWVRETGLKVLIAPEVEKEIDHGLRLLYEPLPADVQSNVIHKSEWWNMDEASSVFNRAHTVVAMEPHSLIMALAHGVPIIHTYSPRHGLKAWMFRDIGLPEWLYDIDRDPSDKMIEALFEIHRDRLRAEVKVKRAMHFVEKRSSEMIKDIQALI